MPLADYARCLLSIAETVHCWLTTLAGLDEVRRTRVAGYAEKIAATLERAGEALRHLEALLLVADLHNIFIVSGNGDVIEPDEGVAAIGSGGPFATAAATALLHHTKLSARQVVEEAMSIAGKICIYTNDKVTYEELG